MYPVVVSGLAWDLWFVSWLVAALWTARTRKRAASGAQMVHWIPTIVGFIALIAATNSYDERGGPFFNRSLWTAPVALDWIFCVICIGGLAFTWWARIYLGSLWSNAVTSKEGHRIVDTGPYRLVRHPIYTGLILAAFALALQVQTVAALVGAALMALGFWLKARLEERFLREELGAADYDAYAATTPMLIPFLPKSR